MRHAPAPSHSGRPRRAARRRRCGAAAATAVIALGLINLLMLGAVRPGPREHQLAVERVQAVRALAAAESGMRLLIDLIERGADLPAEGDELTLTDASCEFVAVPPEGEGEFVIEGRCGSCRRRLSVLLQ